MSKRPAGVSKTPPPTDAETIIEEVGTATPQALNFKLATDAKAILISKGVDPVIASQAADAIVTWAFCILIGRAPHLIK